MTPGTNVAKTAIVVGAMALIPGVADTSAGSPAGLGLDVTVIPRGPVAESADEVVEL